MSDEIVIEVCVDSVASALAAERGGAGRLELCSDMFEGGITPSVGLVQQVRAKTSMALRVMIRPRGGDFCYTSEEFETMQHDIMAAKGVGADGVVLGILHADGSVDTERTRHLVELARPLPVTFHRAFDMSADLFRALDVICETGADRLLTSGGAQTSTQGIHSIAALVQAAGDRIVIMACGGINDANVASVIGQTGVREIHVGLRRPALSPMLHRNSNISMGVIPGREYERFQLLEEDVLSLRHAVARHKKAEFPR
jgi:copper homeostasis protein